MPSFLDVCEIFGRRLDEVRALATDAGRLSHAVPGEIANGRAGGALAGALERVEHVVIHPGRFIIQCRHAGSVRKSLPKSKRRRI